MRYALLATVFLGIWVYGLEARKLPSFVKKCKRDDPELNTCMKNAILDFRKYLPKGNKALKLSPMDPYILERSVLKLSWATIGFTSLKLYNSYDFEVDYFDLDLDRNRIALNLTMNQQWLKCHYRLQGELLQIPLQGDGDVEANFTNTKTSSVITGSKVLKNGKEYLNLEKIDFKLLGDSLDSFYFHNLFGNNEELTKRINELFNESRSELSAEIFPLLESIIKKIYLSFFKGVFDTYSLEELFV